MLTYSTAGESHGPACIALVSGMPEGVPLDEAFFNAELARRQGGYGRGARQRIERDTVEFLSGVRKGHTLGGPLTMVVRNRDARLDDDASTPPVFRPRPGHADLAGSLKWLTSDCRGTLERASARETASRTLAGCAARCLLRELGVHVFGFVRSVGAAATEVEVTPDNWPAILTLRDASDTYCPDQDATQRQCEIIRQAKIDQDTAGGLVEAHVFGVPPGLGTCASWEGRLDARLAGAAMSIQAMKSVEIGLGKAVAALPGSHVHDPIAFDPTRRSEASLGFVRPRNHAGGIEGGMSNGMPIVVRAAMKPIATLLQGMPSIDLRTKQPERSQYERSDVCAVPAASVVLEAVVAFEVARAALEKFGGDTLREVRANCAAYLEAARGI